MARAVGEAHHLVLDRGAVARADALDLAGVQGRPVQVGADQVVPGRRGVGDVAHDLRLRDSFGQGRERLRRVVARLDLEAGVIDGPAVQARRRPGLQPAQAEADLLEPARQAERGRLADAPGRHGLLADVDHAAQEGAGGEHHGPGLDRPAVGVDHAPAAAALVDQKILHRRGPDLEARLVAQQRLHGAAVELAVGLGAGPAHRRALAPVEHAELDAGAVDDPAHQAVQGVDLAHQVALAQAADGRVAGHRPDGLDLVGEQQGARTQARGRGGRLAARVAAAHHDDVKTRHGRNVGTAPAQVKAHGAALHCFT